MNLPSRCHSAKAFAVFGALMHLVGCAAQPPPAAERGIPLVRLGFSIQAGAFAELDNAIRLTETLQAEGLDATFFKAADGLYKVRFGDFTSAAAARRRGEALQRQRIVADYYIVMPNPCLQSPCDSDFLREQIVETAESFLGVPYRWGGDSSLQGFDCSGLTMAVYRLHGLELPRTSKAQFGSGAPVTRRRLAKGDLVFFAVYQKSSVSHVGLYVGDGRFIHAPGRGKAIRIDQLSHPFYDRHFVGGRTYL
jgi:hypothetical protein